MPAAAGSASPFDPEYGGQGLPYVLSAAVGEYFIAANMAFSMYPGLTAGAVAALLTHGTEALKQLYAPKMLEGRWTGTMNLTEPHCGTDLGLLKSQGGAARRRQLRHHRPEDLHLRRRA